jgi:hypothetical protein
MGHHLSRSRRLASDRDGHARPVDGRCLGNRRVLVRRISLLRKDRLGGKRSQRYQADGKRDQCRNPIQSSKSDTSWLQHYELHTVSQLRVPIPKLRRNSPESRRAAEFPQLLDRESQAVQGKGHRTARQMLVPVCCDSTILGGSVPTGDPELAGR